MLVVDASVLAPALGSDNADGDAARQRLRGENLTAPELVDVEVLSVLRRQVVAGRLDERRARFAVADLVDLDLRRVSHRDLLEGCWELRDNVTAYDGCYVVLATLLDVPLLTADARLSRAPRIPCRIELLGAR